MPNKKNEKLPRDNPAFATDDANQENEQMSTEDEQSSPNSLDIASSECGESSAPASANTTSDIGCAQFPNEARTEPDGRGAIPTTSYQVKGQFFFREDSELQSSTEIVESQSNPSLTGSTARLCLPPSPPADERRPPNTLAVPPSNLSIVPTISVSKDPSASEESSTKRKTKGGLGYTFNKLMTRLSPAKEKVSPSATSVSPGSSIETGASSSSSDKPKSKKTSPMRFLLGKEKSPKDSPDKKKKSPSKLKSLVENALHPKKKLFPQRCGEESDHLTEFKDPPKTKSEEKPKRAKDHWESVAIPKDFKKVESTNFSETTVDSLSTQHSFTTDSPMSDILNSNQEDVTDQDPEVPQIPESSKPESDKEESDKE